MINNLKKKQYESYKLNIFALKTNFYKHKYYLQDINRHKILIFF